jgi:hypothetical protein
MTTAIRRHSTIAVAMIAALAALTTARNAGAIPVDNRGELKLGMRAYTAVRVGTQEIGDSDNPLNYPGSGAGHVRQHRYFLQLDFDHDLTRLAKTGWGPPRVFGLIDQLLGLAGWDDPLESRYTVQYRGEGEGIYDYGPSEYANQGDKMRAVAERPRARPAAARAPHARSARVHPRAQRPHRAHRPPAPPPVPRLHRLREGPLFLRIGRQILAWGETDVFRLLDNINPLDDSFGGFFIALDERRLPIEMVRSSFRFGSFGPIQDAFMEGFVANGKQQAVVPGIPAGSPWAPGGIARPNPQVRALADPPDYEDIRGGARLVFTAYDVTATIAHYYTYLDIPGVRFALPGPRDCGGSTGNTARFCNPILAFQEFPRVPITGAAITFPLESFYTIVRSEAAYFQDEPMNRQGVGNSNDTIAEKGTAGYRRLVAQNNTEGGLDPFVWPRFIDPNTLRKHRLYGKLRSATRSTCRSASTSTASSSG